MLRKAAGYHNGQHQILDAEEAVAEVNKKGKITAKKAGTCNVYVYAQNGVFKKIKVIVKK